MGTKIFLLATSVAAAIVLTGCSSAPPPATKAETKAVEPAKPAEAVAARSAYFEMYKAARAWAPDLLALTLKSGEVPSIKNEGGHAGAWIAVFVSPSRKEARTFTYAVAGNGADLSKGINVSDKQNWGGATPAAKAFANGEFSIDSDIAYTTATGPAGAWLKTHPGAKATMLLGNSARFPGPVWYIMWGTSKDGYAVYVNATTGAVINK
ncbi:MAG TPA: hypothetical protein VGK29_18225 [Paludibaculum sp.]